MKFSNIWKIETYIHAYWLCEVAVLILWRTIQNYNTIITCLPNESKELLYKNDIILSTPTSKPLLFNYIVFVKTLSIGDICGKNLIPQNWDDNKCTLIT